MAKILIAGLGKGMIDRNSEERDYRKADYKIKIEETGEYKIYRDEYFVTSVLEKHYDIDKTIYIGRRRGRTRSGNGDFRRRTVGKANAQHRKRTKCENSRPHFAHP